VPLYDTVVYLYDWRGCATSQQRAARRPRRIAHCLKFRVLAQRNPSEAEEDAQRKMRDQSIFTSFLPRAVHMRESAELAISLFRIPDLE